MAAERTFLAWIRSGIALMAFGFVVARFGLFLRELTGSSAAAARTSPHLSLALGLALISVGIVPCIVSAFRHRRYVRALDAGRFRAAFDSVFAFGIVALLVAVASAMLVVLVVM